MTFFLDNNYTKSIKTLSCQTIKGKVKGGGEWMENQKAMLKIDSYSFNDTLNKINELNEALKKAKSLINELAESKVLLNLNLEQATREDFQGNLTP